VVVRPDEIGADDAGTAGVEKGRCDHQITFLQLNDTDDRGGTQLALPIWFTGHVGPARTVRMTRPEVTAIVRMSTITFAPSAVVPPVLARRGRPHGGLCETVEVRRVNRLAASFAVSLATACTGSGASQTSETMSARHPPTPLSAAPATATPETTTTSTPLAYGDILIASPQSPTSTTANDNTVLFGAGRAFGEPSGIIVFQRAGDSTIRADHPDGSAHVAISPAPKTHLRLYDAGLALGVESILYSTIDEDDVAQEVLHISNVDGANSRTLGNIGFWEGQTLAAHLGNDRVVSEERTAGAYYPTSFDLKTGDRNNLPVSNSGATALSVSDDSAVEAHMEDKNLIVSRLNNGVGSITIPLTTELVDRLFSIEISPTQAIINTSDSRPVLIKFPPNLTGATNITTLGVTGYASFIEHPTPAEPASTGDTKAIDSSDSGLGTPVLCPDPWLQPFCTDTVEITDTSTLAFAPVTFPTLGTPNRVATNGAPTAR
jgi:hypothetical protein